MKRTFLITTFTLTMALIASAFDMTHAAQTALQKKDITIGMPSTDWPPYLISTTDNQHKGVLIDIFRAITEPMGYTTSAVHLPDKRTWELLGTGEVNALAMAKEWTANPDQFLWSEPFMLNEDVLLYLADSDLQYTAPQSLFGKSVAAITGFVYPALEPYFATGQITRVDTNSPYTMLELLSRHRVDAAMVNRAETQWFLRNHPNLEPERFRMDQTPFDSAWYRYVFIKTPQWERFVVEFNKQLRAMKRDGTLPAILDQYR
ncbi:substrate-binding periplasmic protein [Pseudodesulfovibrio sediminis]|uniref:ABC transporter substrate-binding protein n=1 Tax=Pseudodesulfovibrio sediminis TaxID=2810563 RepID=A0ABN6EWA9_9BACT|nr:transporter substrate-binding domain-containing protein [Pseudodesulfovibrio sediminis]BCS89349.1 ABC transporter substrate-binding protein [Pseudodesulfovibrio sediminis]